MRNSFARIIGLFSVIALVSGCGSTAKHTNVMVFGTNTKFGFDVGTSPAGAAPELTIGYARQELVWMPLLANVDSSQNATTQIQSSSGSSGNGSADSSGNNARAPAICGQNCMYVGKDAGDRIDTYSVLASFGAKFGGRSAGPGPQGTSASGSGGLAQFFATGIAARNLALSGGARLVSIRGADAEELAKTEQLLAYKNEEIKRIEERLRSKLGDDEYERILREVPSKAKTLREKADEILDHITKDGSLSQQDWRELVEGAGISGDIGSDLKAYEELRQVKRYLDAQVDGLNERHIDALHKALGGGEDD